MNPALAFCGAIAIVVLVLMTTISASKSCNQDGGVLVRGIIGLECVAEIKPIKQTASHP